MSWFNNNLKVRAKFLVAGLVILPFLLGLGAVGVGGVVEINHVVDSLYSEQFATVIDISNTGQAIQESRRQLFQAVGATNSQDIENYLAATSKQLELAHKSLNEYIQDDGQHPAEEQKLIENVETAWKTWDEQVAQVTALARLNTTAARQEGTTQLGAIKSADQGVITALNEVINYSNGEADDAKAEAVRTFTLVLWLVGVLAVLAVVVFVSVMLFLSNAVTRPLIKLQRATNLLAAGALDSRVAETRQAQDELAQLTRAFNLMAQRLQESYQTSETVSNEVLILTNQLNTTAEQQASSNQEQVAAVSQVTTSLEELNETADQIAGAARQVAKAVTQSAELSESVAAASKIAYRIAEEGTQALDQSFSRVEEVQRCLEMVGQELQNLTNHSNQISAVVDLIDSLADQTHLLALNASIEAAGEENYLYQPQDSATGASITRVNGNSPAQTENNHYNIRSVRGARFGVIAQEVKALADRSRNATEDVRLTLSQTQEAIKNAVVLAESTKNETSKALDRSQLAGTVIARLNQTVTLNAEQVVHIARTIGEVEQRAEEIRLATSQQHSANQQILATMRGLMEITRDNSSAISQLSHTASAVNSQMYELNSLIRQIGLAQVAVEAAATAQPA